MDPDQTRQELSNRLASRTERCNVSVAGPKPAPEGYGRGRLMRGAINNDRRVGERWLP
jgi:hypothetical protein